MNCKRTIASRSGFTLLEVVLGLALMFVIVGAAANLAWTVGDRRAALARIHSLGRSGDAVLESITDDLLSSVAYPDLAEVLEDAGNESTSPPLVIVCRAPAGIDAIEPPRSGLVRAIYTLEPSGRLTRRSNAIEGGESTTVLLAEGVERFQCRVHNGLGWQLVGEGVRGSAEGVPAWPRAVEVALWFGPDGAGAVSGQERSARMPDRLRVIAVPDADPAGDDRRAHAPLEEG